MLKDFCTIISKLRQSLQLTATRSKEGIMNNTNEAKMIKETLDSSIRAAHHATIKAFGCTFSVTILSFRNNAKIDNVFRGVYEY